MYSCKCEACGNEFEGGYRRKFCNQRCMGLGFKNRASIRHEHITCKYCGKVVESYYKGRMFCSHKCASAYRRGRDPNYKLNAREKYLYTNFVQRRALPSVCDSWSTGKKVRVLAMMKISPNLLCCKYGCNILDILEINHKNGGGSKEKKLIGAVPFYASIIRGERRIDDLELTCKVCNIVHYVSMLGYDGFMVKYEEKTHQQKAYL